MKQTPEALYSEAVELAAAAERITDATPRNRQADLARRMRNLLADIESSRATKRAELMRQIKLNDDHHADIAATIGTMRGGRAVAGPLARLVGNLIEGERAA